MKVGCGIRIQDRDSFPDFWYSHSGFSRGTKNSITVGMLTEFVAAHEVKAFTLEAVRD